MLRGESRFSLYSVRGSAAAAARCWWGARGSDGDGICVRPVVLLQSLEAFFLHATSLGKVTRARMATSSASDRLAACLGDEMKPKRV